ncbi:SulP family inorganic anion transporter [Alkalicoccus urumqiensis]|uniref:Sodium-independent anion transporter n=1 Tax=Alkalicoccus urumqiensis TaxID=1548213 RepID=A0A2P6MIH0_ALKUR|nr:sulfate permease [Alkalicoccus urumqiensis]PRO66092.1 sodium-independent anion transporter [Alkalicoccus urumqiensis]
MNLPKPYTKNDIQQDITAGLTVLVMLVPQGMAYALLAGLPPVMGLYAATIPLLIYALLGTSRHLAVGPVAMASILIYTGVSALAEPMSESYITLVLILTLMVGVLQLALGLINAGALIKFVSQSVISGFTSAVAIIIGMSQLGSFFGISMPSENQLIPLFTAFVQNVDGIHWPTALVGLISLVLLVTIPKFTRRLPVPLLVTAGTIAAASFWNLDAQGVAIVGDVPQGFPAFQVPDVSFPALQILLPTALTIALIAMMESLAITKTLAGRDSPPLNVNKELRAIGSANVIGSLFSAYAVTGSFSRSAVNHRNGAVSQVSSIVTAVGVIITLLFFTPLFYYLPQTVLAAIILAAVAGLINFRVLRKTFAVKPSDGVVWIVTFVSTLTIGMQWGLLVGVGVSLCILLNRISHPHIVELGWDAKNRRYVDVNRFDHAVRVPQFILLRIDARLHFSNVEYVEKQIESLIHEKDKESSRYHIVVDMGGVNDIDTMGITSMERMLHRYDDGDLTLRFVNVKGPVADLIDKAGWSERTRRAVFTISLDYYVKQHQPEQDYMI